MKTDRDERVRQIRDTLATMAQMDQSEPGYGYIQIYVNHVTLLLSVLDSQAAEQNNLQLHVEERDSLLSAGMEAGEVSAAPRMYFCSCGGALSAEEYITHYFELGHDRGEVSAAPVVDSLVCDADRWKCDLIAAGWIAESALAWRAPDGSLWRGPFGAWKELQRRVAANGTDTNWPLSDVLTQLVAWAKHLHDDHECDCHGWEARSFLIEAASRYAAAPLAAPVGDVANEAANKIADYFNAPPSVIPAIEKIILRCARIAGEQEK